ncbi:peptidylprolyl isomerase [Bacillus weihaiensis]|uniref:peptidylprolyl isomerase n=1 Tax=Bacillus weihaiensis TaxID=1547283 RepID=UPI002353F519|nr:peptidylprolyl isomerase [Bacillus weihaiensis]
MKKKYLFSFLFCVLLVGCGGKEEIKSKTEGANQAQPETIEQNPIVTMTMENDESIKIELYPMIAPNTVNNFISLAESGFYDGLLFHRVIPNFMIQGGDPNGNGTGGPTYSIKGEFSSNGFENNVKHERGIISMARSQAPDSAGSQFFIMVEDTSSLDGDYAAFGKVIEGMETVDSIVSVKTNDSDKPIEEQKIKEVTVNTFGINYPEPEKLK